MLTPSRFEQTYSHVPTTPAPSYAGTLTALAIDYDATDDSVVTTVPSPFNLKCCGGSLLVTPGLYLLCAILDLIAINCKLAILYWVALFICVILCIFCCRCSSISLLSQVLFGLFVYLYWWNCIGMWHRPHYHTTPAWPWTPRL